MILNKFTWNLWIGWNARKILFCFWMCL